MSIPLNAIDPEAQSLRDRRSFEHHLDLLAPVMDAIVTGTVPHIRASVTDKIIVSGGGPVDNMTAFLVAFDQSDHGRGVESGGAAADATNLWWQVVDYVHAVAEWIGQPSPALSQKPDADPLLARGIAMTTAGWLIDRWPLIEPIHELDETRDELFTEIRHMQGRYGVFAKPRRPRARCAVCGAVAVVVTWVDNPNGSAKPVKAGRCMNCAQTYDEFPEPPQQPHTVARVTVSEACADLAHEACKSIHCECPCGHAFIEEGKAA